MTKASWNSVYADTCLCKKCKRRFPMHETVTTENGRLCKTGYGCQIASCEAIRRSGNPCSSPMRESRVDDSGKPLRLCRNHALGFDHDLQERGPEYAAYRVRYGLPPT